MAKPCATVFLSDRPVAKDEVSADGVAPHARIADAIALTVENQEGGRVISLHGTWGSGKSTVVEMVRERLSEATRMVTFDAWSHQGDLLRRAFVERLVSQLAACGWPLLDQRGEITWRDRLSALAGRRKETRKTIAPSLSLFGKAVALALFLVPFGSTILAQALRDGITVSPGDISWLFWIGFVLALSPLWVSIGFYFATGKNHFFSDAPRIEHISEEFDTPSPGSIEFEEAFRSIVQCVLTDESRRLVIVVDNIDRLSDLDVPSVWSTLQTFLAGPDARWLRRLWFLIPLNSRVRSISGGCDVGAASTSDSLAKSLNIQFELPPPVLSNWRHYLNSKLAIAFPGHNAEEIATAVDIFSNSLRGHNPAPREIIVSVNSMAALHMQWCGSGYYGIADLAAFICLKREHADLIRWLSDGNRISDSLAGFLGGGDIEKFAGLAFNTDPDTGLQLLLAPRVLDAIFSGDVDSFVRLAGRHGRGFLAVLKSGLLREVNENNPDGLANASRLVAAIKEADGSLGESVILLRSQLRKVLPALSDQVTPAPGLGKAFAYLANTAGSPVLIRRLGALLLDGKGEGRNNPGAIDRVREFAIFVDEIRTTNLALIKGEKFLFVADSQFWLDYAPEFIRLSKVHRTLLTHIERADFPGAVDSALAARISNDQLLPRIPEALSCLRKLGATEWPLLADACGAIASKPAEGVLIFELLRIMLQLSSDDSPLLRPALRPSNLVRMYESSKDQRVDAAVVFTLAFYAFGGGRSPNYLSGHSVATAAIEASLAATDCDVAVSAVMILDESDRMGLVLEIINQRRSVDPLISTMLHEMSRAELSFLKKLPRYADVESLIDSD